MSDDNFPYSLTNEAEAERKQIRQRLEKRKEAFRASRKKRKEQERLKRYMFLALLVVTGFVVGGVLFLIGNDLSDLWKNLLQAIGSGIVTTALAIAMFDITTNIWDDESEEADLEELFQTFEDFTVDTTMLSIFSSQSDGDAGAKVELTWRFVQAIAEKNGITAQDIDLSDLDELLGDKVEIDEQVADSSHLEDKDNTTSDHSQDDVEAQNYKQARSE